MRERFKGSVKQEHPYHGFWEPLEAEVGFVLRSMFGGRSVYLDEKLVLYFSAKEEPWRGLLICTEREHHASLQEQFPMLVPHEVLPKWLYLSEEQEEFERVARKLVALTQARDARIGVLPKPKKRKKPPQK